MGGCLIYRWGHEKLNLVFLDELVSICFGFFFWHIFTVSHIQTFKLHLHQEFSTDDLLCRKSNIPTRLVNQCKELCLF